MKCECCGADHEEVGRYEELGGQALCVDCAPCPRCGETGGACYQDGNIPRCSPGTGTVV